MKTIANAFLFFLSIFMTIIFILYLLVLFFIGKALTIYREIKL